jgi:hypothetical protein
MDTIEFLQFRFLRYAPRRPWLALIMLALAEQENVQQKPKSKESSSSFIGSF